MSKIIETSESTDFYISYNLLREINELTHAEFKIFCAIYKELYNQNSLDEVVFMKTSQIKESVGMISASSSSDFYKMIESIEKKGFLDTNQKEKRKKGIDDKEIKGMVNGFFQVRLSEKTKNLLKTNDFLDLDFSILLSFEHNATRKLYSMLKHAKTSNRRDMYYPLNELLFNLGAIDKYTRISTFKSKSLIPSIKEINEKTEMTINDIIVNREGRTITGFSFLTNIRQSSELNIVNNLEIFRNDMVKKLIELGVHQEKAELSVLKRPKEWINKVIDWANEKKRRAILGVDKVNFSLFGGLVCKLIFDRFMDETKLYLKAIKTKFGKESTSVVLEPKKSIEKPKTSIKTVENEEDFIDSYKTELCKVLFEKQNIEEVYFNNIGLISKDRNQIITELESRLPVVAKKMKAIELFKLSVITLSDNILKNMYNKVKGISKYQSVSMDFDLLINKIKG